MQHSSLRTIRRGDTLVLSTPLPSRVRGSLPETVCTCLGMHKGWNLFSFRAVELDCISGFQLWVCVVLISTAYEKIKCFININILYKRSLLFQKIQNVITFMKKFIWLILYSYHKKVTKYIPTFLITPGSTEGSTAVLWNDLRVSFPWAVGWLSHRNLSGTLRPGHCTRRELWGA